MISLKVTRAYLKICRFLNIIAHDLKYGSNRPIV